jgi:hypothetical protein
MLISFWAATNITTMKAIISHNLVRFQLPSVRIRYQIILPILELCANILEIC